MGFKPVFLAWNLPETSPLILMQLQLVFII